MNPKLPQINLKKAMEEMECWQAQKHLKSCKKCSSFLFQDIEKKLPEEKGEGFMLNMFNDGWDSYRQEVLQILKEKKYEERKNI